MLTRLLHRAVARPWVYDLRQLAVGATYVRGRLARRIAPYHASPIVLDIGGGTGAVRKLWSPASRYICLDIDPQKLEGYSAKNPDGLALLADATNIPIADASVDAVVCTSVTHHLTDVLLDRMLAQSARILRPSGRLILLDAIWAPCLPAGRLLWRYDRGSYPRPAAALRRAIAAHFDITHWEQFTLWHAYFITVAHPHARLHTG